MKIYYMNIEELPKRTEDLLLAIAQEMPTLYQNIEQKLAKLKNEADQKRSLSAYLLLLYAYHRDPKNGGQDQMQEQGANSRMLRISCHVDGKPFFEGSGQPYFNLSHSGQYAVCAYDTASECGVDIQEIRVLKQRFVERFFSEKEQQAVSGQTSPEGHERNRICTEIWSKKESLGKCIGCGLRGNEEMLDTESSEYHIGIMPFHENADYVLSYCSQLPDTPELAGLTYSEVVKTIFTKSVASFCLI